MARGYPDFFSLPTFPSYGLTRKATGSVIVNAGTIATILTVSGKGVLYDGTLYLLGVAGSKNDEVTLKVDGSISLSTSFSLMLSYGWIHPIIGRTHLTVMSVDPYRYGVMVDGPISYGQTLVWIYKNTTITNVTVEAYFFYANVL